MKVLMFGWEFPPHISGGLGTACAGLTRALEETEVNVLFAVPKLHGGEQADRTTFINASHIPIRQKKIFTEDEQTSSPMESRESSDLPFPQSIKTMAKGRHTLLEVPSLLMPYINPAESHEWRLQDWNYSLSDKDDRSVPAYLRSGPPAKTSYGKKAIRYVKEPYAFSGSYGFNLMEEVARYADAGAEISRRHDFDVIHAHDWMTYPAGIAAKKISGKPLIVHVHATEIDRSGSRVNPEVFAIEKEGMQFADRVVTVSNWTKNVAIHHYQIDEKKIVVIHNGVAPKINKSISSAGPPLNSPIVTFLGRITQQKGPSYFVEAARKVHERLPNVHFVVAGSGDQLPEIIQRIAQLKLSENFHFTGFLQREDIDSIWAMSNIYVMPSVSEPFGIAPLEAIQAGVPVILSRQAGVSEVMPDAIKIDFWNTDALAEAICNLLRFNSLASTLRKNSAEQIKNITWDKAAQKLTTLYYELSSKHEKQEESRPLLSGSPAQKTAATAVL